MAEPFDLHKALDDILECALCLETLADPKYLPCHHYLCAKCLQELITRSDSKSSIKCPTCRTPVVIESGDVQAFPAAFLINRLKDVAIQGKKRKNAETRISETSTTPAELLCSSEKHHPQPVVLFCEPCQDLVCETCCKEEHKGHSKNNFLEVVETHRNILSENNNSFENRLKEYEARQEHLSKAKEDFQDTVECHSDHVKQQGDKLVEIVQAAVFKIQQELKTESEKVMKEVEEQGMAMSKDVDELTATNNNIKLSLTQDNPAKIIHTSVKEGAIHRKQLSLLKANHRIPRNRIALQLTDLNLLTDSALVGEMYLDSLVSLANSTDTTSISSGTEDEVFVSITNVTDIKTGYEVRFLITNINSANFF